MAGVAFVVVSVALAGGFLAICRGSLLWGCAGFLVVSSCFSTDFWKLSGGLPLTLDRAYLAVLVVAYSVQRYLGRTRPKRLETCDWLLIALVGWVSFSTFTHDFLAPAEEETIPLWRLISGYIMPFTVYWIAVHSKIDQRNLTVFYAILATFGVYLAVTGILEIAGHWSLVFPQYISDPKLGIHFGRARGPFLNSISYGLFVAVGLCALLTCWKRMPLGGRLASLAAVPVMLCGVYFSYTRTIWAGTAAALLVILGFALSGRVRLVALGGIVTVGLLAATMQLDQLVSLEREHSGSDSRHSTVMRASFTYISWKMFLDHPLMGVGFGHFPKEKLPYLSDRTTPLHLEATRSYGHHSTFLSLLTETGIVGMGLFTALLLVWLKRGWNVATNPTAPGWMKSQGIFLLAALGVYFFQLLFHELTYKPVDNTAIWLLAGITIAISSAQKGPRFDHVHDEEYADGNTMRRQQHSEHTAAVEAISS